MTDNSMFPDSGNVESTPNDRALSARVLRWNAERADLAATISPDTDYKRLIWNVLFHIGASDLNQQFMLDKECHVAQRIVEWLNDHPQYDHYAALIKEVPYINFAALEITTTLLFNLWRITDASLWISTRDAANYQDQLWQMAVVRTSAYLNTGSFVPGGGQ